VSNLPRISVVIPCLNRAAFIEKAIDSVLSQDYPDIELIIMDGGSTDGTVDIIKRYAPRLACWVSEPDSGQSAAINKGLRRITGELFAFLNSDDWYYPGAFRAAAEALAAANAGVLKHHWVSGSIKALYPDGKELVYPLLPADYSERLLRDRGWCATGPRMPCGWGSCFWRRELLELVGYFREDLHYTMDVEYHARLYLHGFPPLLIEPLIAGALLHPGSKTVGGTNSGEKDRFCGFFASLLSPRELRRARFLTEVRRIGRISGDSRLKWLAPVRLLTSGVPFTYPLQFASGLMHRVRGQKWSGQGW